MKTDTEILGKKLEEIRNLLLELECLKKDIQTLVDDKEEYFEMMIKESRFFYRLYLNYIRLFIIDVHKLIDSKENYNIKSLINFCRTNIKRINWNREISSDELDLLEDKLKKVSEYFEQISLLRNKFYAHNDKNKDKFSFNITLSEFWNVLEVLQNIFSKINIHFDNHHWIFPIQYPGTSSIKDAYKFMKIRLLYLEASKHNSNIDMIKLRNIIRS